MGGTIAGGGAGTSGSDWVAIGEAAAAAKGALGEALAAVGVSAAGEAGGVPGNG
jgi:hypothetical protein